MPTRSELYPSTYLKAVDVDPPITATIDRAVFETVGRGSKADQKVVLYFTDPTIKPYPVNATVFKAMEEISGYENSDDWSGTEIELYAVDCTDPQGQPARGVRVRRPRTRAKAKAAAGKRPAALPPPDDIAVAMPSLADPFEEL
jgi:hypothetical protein